MDGNRHAALVLDLGRLRSELGAVAEVAAAVHGRLEGVSLPAKDVVAVLAVSGPERGVSDTTLDVCRWPCANLPVSGREKQRLAAVLGPLAFVAEVRRVPRDLFSGTK